MNISIIDHKRRITAVLALIIFGGFMATIWISYRVAHHSLGSQIADNTLPLTSDNIYSEIQQDLLRPLFISSLMAHDTFVRDWAIADEDPSESMVRYLQEIQNRYGTITSFFISEKSRRYYHPTGILKEVSDATPDDRWFFRVRAMPEGEDYEINIDADTADRTRATIFVNYRVYDYQRNFLGVTGVGLAVSKVKRLIELYEKKYGRKVFFVDREGEVTLHGDMYTGERNLRDMPGVAALATRILISPSGSYSFKKAGRKVYMNSRLVPEFKWYLIVAQEEIAEERLLLKTVVGNAFLGFLVTAAVLVLAHFTFRGYQRRLEEMAATDKLTGSANRQVFEELIAQTLRAAERKKENVSVVMFDLDLFKKINDTHGHIKGDKVLKSVAGRIRRLIRASDILCRWGGEEFVVLLTDCNMKNGRERAERMRRSVEGNRVEEIQVTISLGVAEYCPGESPEELLDRADQALYQAKSEGRNRVACAS